MADKDKYSFIVVKYPQKDTADAALKAVLGLAKEKVVKLRDAVVITKTDKGKIKLHQTKDDPTSKGLLKGGAHRRDLRALVRAGGLDCGRGGVWAGRLPRSIAASRTSC